MQENYLVHKKKTFQTERNRFVENKQRKQTNEMQYRETNVISTSGNFM